MSKKKYQKKNKKSSQPNWNEASFIKQFNLDFKHESKDFAGTILMLPQKQKDIEKLTKTEFIIQIIPTVDKDNYQIFSTNTKEISQEIKNELSKNPHCITDDYVYKNLDFIGICFIVQSGKTSILEKFIDLHSANTFEKHKNLYYKVLTEAIVSIHYNYSELAKKIIDKGIFKLHEKPLGKKSIFELVTACEKNSSILKLTNCEMFKYVVESNKFDLNECYKRYAGYLLTPLMQFVIDDNFQAIKILVDSGNVDINTKTKHTTKNFNVNALSFVSDAFHSKITKFFIENNIEYISTALLNNRSIEQSLKVASNLQIAIERASYYNKRIDIIKDISSIDEFEPNQRKIAIKKAQDLLVKLEAEESNSSDDKEMKKENSDVVIDKLLLKYFAASNKKKEDIANDIRNLCNESSELALELVTILNEKYTKCDKNITELVNEVIYNPKLIHKFFQERKSIAIKKQLKHLETQNEDYWNVGDNKVLSSECIEVKSQMSSKIYIKIADNLNVNTTNGLTNLKLLAKNSLGINGIKFRNDLGIVVLKTKQLGDDRLVAQGVFKDDNGDMLLYFTERCNHTKVENWSKKSIIDLHTLLDDTKLSDDDKEIKDLAGDTDNPHPDSDMC